MPTSTLVIPPDFGSNVLSMAQGVFTNFLASPLAMILGIMLALLVVEVIIGAFRK